MSIELELYDDKTENYILSKVFQNNDIKKILLEIILILEKKEKIDLGKNLNFLTTLYKKVGFISESKLDNETKKELMILFFGDDILSIENLPHIIDGYSNNVENFRNLKIEQKGFIFYLIELLIEKKININDEHYDFFIESKKDRELITDIIIELCIYGLELLKKDIDVLLENQHNFLDKYFSFEQNYLSNKELEWFRNTFYEMVHFMYIYLSSKDEIKQKISDIQKRIENRVKFD